jgi:hypothetical protein
MPPSLPLSLPNPKINHHLPYKSSISSKHLRYLFSKATPQQHNTKRSIPRISLLSFHLPFFIISRPLGGV